MKGLSIGYIFVILMIGIFFAVTLCAKADSLILGYPLQVTLAKKPAVYSFRLQDVRLLDGPCRQAMSRNIAWMKSLEPDRLLSGFHKEAGFEPKAPVYGGWEDSTLTGHTLGHYLSAVSMAYAATEDPDLKKRVDYIVDELATCQNVHQDGYVSGIPNGKKIFEEEIAKGNIRVNPNDFRLNELWVPWYVHHKVLAGLRDVYVYTQNEKALSISTKLADWIIDVTRSLTHEQWQTMLLSEYGGMMEVLADVYALTGDEKYLSISKQFYDDVILDPLSRRQDCLPNLHSNTQIPKIIGAARLYELTGEEKFGTISDFFYQTVVHHYTFINGGNSVVERFGQPDQLSELLYHTTENCCAYNMLKLSRHLYALNPQTIYMDYYEQALWNHILAHQSRETGMIKYKGFLDMPARKKYSTPFDSFWCCVGTGFENHSKYGECIWAYGADGLYLNQFIASELNWKEKGLVVKLETDFPESDTLTLTFAGRSMPCPLRIRKPGWAEGVTCTINGRPQEDVLDGGGYLVFNRIRSGDVLEMKMPMKLHVETMPDKPDRMVFLYGPIVLAADLSGGESLSPPDGPGHSLRLKDLLVGDPLPMLIGAPQEILCRIKPIPGRPLEFMGEKISKGFEENAVPVDIRLMPLYKIINEKYTVYMDTFTDSQRRECLQIQRSLNVAGENLSTGQHAGNVWRQAEDGGWFAFDVKTPGTASAELILTYWCDNKKDRIFDILVEDVKIAEENMKTVHYRPYTDIAYSIPTELIGGKEKVRVKLAARPGKIAGPLFEAKIVPKKALD